MAVWKVGFDFSKSKLGPPSKRLRLGFEERRVTLFEAAFDLS